MSTRSTRKLGLLIALVLATAALGWLWLLPFDSTERAAPQPQAPLAGHASAGAAVREPRFPASSTRAQPRPRAPAPSAGCTPNANRECHQGDVYWLDSCGARGEKAEECGARLCQLDACEPADELACAGLPLEGVCDGNVVRGCLSGWPFERDCAALGKRCVIGAEGALCRESTEDDCDRHGALPRCEGQKVLSCLGGKRVVRDCAAMNARCEIARHTGLPACVVATELDRPPRDSDPCGPCGCPEGLPEFGEEACNGRDDDGDTWIDEDVSCEPLEVVAYVVTDDAGGSSHSREDIEQEVALLDALFSADHGGLPMRVELARVIELARPDYLSLDDAELDEIVNELNDTHGGAAGPGVHVPIVFTDEVLSDDVPKAGLSTLPNGYCGGSRRALSPQPLRGLVAVGKRRATTTVAHEVGHFLGLCHTHETDTEAVVRVARYTDAHGRFEQTCEATCSLDGDGICDTPHDPGPDLCSYDTECVAHCESEAAPSTRNLMSYYTACRDHLTPLQTVTLHRSRALLEGFYRCAEPGACPCVLPGMPALEDQVPVACPEQMSCRPSRAGGFACSLDGAFLDGEPCRAHAECGQGLLCIEHRCTPSPTL